MHSTKDSILNLNKARKLALGDAALYPKIIPGVLPIVGPHATLELRRWGAEFLAETFAAPAFAVEQKQELSLGVLETLGDYLDAPEQDTAVVKCVVQAATSIYPLVFKHVIYNPGAAQTWQKMTNIKSTILKRTDTYPAGVRICCIKFIQRVVQVQTHGLIADPRRPEQNETSLALVPRDHPLINASNLEAEAFGLLDRLLGVFQDVSSDALQVTATLNSVGILVRVRPSIANRILNAILNFNPFSMAGNTITPRIKVEMKSMERTLRAFLLNFSKRNPNHPSAGRVQGYLDRLQQARTALLEEGSRKRPAPSEPTDGLDPVKRQRLGAGLPEAPLRTAGNTPLPEGQISHAQLFSLTQDEAVRGFDVQALPFELVSQIIVPLLATIDQQQLANAINVVRNRYLHLTQPRRTSPLAEAGAATGMATSSDNESIDVEDAINIMDSQRPSAYASGPPEVTLGPFIIPQPPPLTDVEVDQYGKGAVTRVFSMVAMMEDGRVTKTNKIPFNGLVASDNAKDTWTTVVTRLATRALAGLDNTPNGQQRGISMANNIRESLFNYILGDFRRRIDLAISWLNEEWYNDQIQAREGSKATVQYGRWALKILDGIVPFLDAKDNKILIRFLSEIPDLDADVVERVKRLAQDPERVQLATTALHYLALFRPPVRSLCVDALEDLWRNYEDAKAAAKKLLQKWRPKLLSSEDDKGAADSKSPVPASAATAAA